MRGSISTRTSSKSTTMSCASSRARTTRRRKSSWRWSISLTRLCADRCLTLLRPRFFRRDVADPAVGTGTFLLGVLRQIAATVEDDEGPGAVRGAIEAAVKRLIAFELQFGPFAVAQLRLMAEMQSLMGMPLPDLRMFVTDTLGNPFIEEEQLGQIYEPIANRGRKRTSQADEPDHRRDRKSPVQGEG